jgi:hypothetical protein
MKRALRVFGVYTSLGVLGLVALLVSGLAGQDGGAGERFAKRYWNERMTNCGGSYVLYVPQGEVVGECRKPSIFAKSLDLTEADHLNGWGWKGWSGIKCSSLRVKYGVKGTFMAWMSEANANYHDTWQRNGAWVVNDEHSAVHPACALLK